MRKGIFYVLFIMLAGTGLIGRAFAENMTYGGLNQYNGKAYQTREELGSLERDLKADGYVLFAAINPSERNLLLSAKNGYWFERYLWFPFTDEDTKLYLRADFLQEALVELDETDHLSDECHTKLVTSAVVVCTIGEDAKESYGKEYYTYNERLVNDMYYTYAYGQESIPDYVLFETPIDAVVEMEIMNTNRHYTFYLQANHQTKLLLIEQCIVSKINGIDVSRENKITTAFEKANVCDITEIVEEYHIKPADLNGYYTKDFSMDYDEWEAFRKQIPIGKGYEKPVWTADGAVPPEEVVVPDLPFKNGEGNVSDKAEPEADDTLPDKDTFLEHRVTVGKTPTTAQKKDKASKRVQVTVILFVTLVSLAVVAYIAVITERKKKEEESVMEEMKISGTENYTETDE